MLIGSASIFVAWTIWSLIASWISPFELGSAAKQQVLVSASRIVEMYVKEKTVWHCLLQINNLLCSKYVDVVHKSDEDKSVVRENRGRARLLLP